MLGLRGIATLVGILIIALTTPQLAAQADTERANPSANPTALNLVNAERQAAGCGQLHADSRLDEAARRHSEDMARNNYLAHDALDGSTPWDRAKNAGYADALAENIGLGYLDARAVVQGWMNSPGHRANILNCEAHAMGIGTAHAADGTVYWTQLFGAK